MNTKYFQRIANGRKRKNTIISLKNDNGIIEGDENLIKHATDYYKMLFGPAPGNAFPLDPNMWENDEKVTEEENEELIKPFSEAEVKFKWKKTRLPALIPSH